MQFLSVDVLSSFQRLTVRVNQMGWRISRPHPVVVR